MAHYEAAARSNYFKVKDRAALEDELNAVFSGLVQVAEGREGDKEKEGRIFVFTDTSLGEGDWPVDFSEDEMGDGRQVWDVVAAHLEDGEVAVFFESGHEGSSYVAGWAVAINNKGQQERVDIRDIYERAEKLGGVVTEAHY